MKFRRGRFAHLKRPDWLLIGCALAITWTGALSLSIQRASALFLAQALLTSSLAVVGQWSLNRYLPAGDRFLFPLAMLLSSFGLLSLGRTAPNFLPRQMLWLLFANAAFYIVVAARRSMFYWLRRFKYTVLAAALLLLMATLLLGVNPSGSGPRLWLNLGGALFVQPSELLRLCVMAFLASHFATAERAASGGAFRSADKVTWGAAGLVVLASAALLIIQQDFGSASMLALTALGMTFLARGPSRWIAASMACFVIATVAAVLISPRLMQRIATWLNPWLDPRGASFQISQSLIAIAEGGLLGRGLGQGMPDYVPAVHTDFPFVMIAEEMGVLGGAVVLTALYVLVMRIWRVSVHASSCYAVLLSGGTALSMALQAFVILGGNMALLPLTGVTVPFVSYGGTSLLVNWLCVAFAVALSAENTQPTVVESSCVGTRRSAQQLARLTLLGTVLLVAALVRWGILSPSLRLRDDNPRLIIAERATMRGPILDRYGRWLAYSTCVGSEQPMVPCARPLPDHRYERVYPAPEASHAIGYYSFRHGLAGAEAFGDVTLRGSRAWWQEWLHELQVGEPITLTLDLQLQRRLLKELRTRANCSSHELGIGAVVALDWRTGELHALGSVPYFNPAALDAEWEKLRRDPSAPLLNRATQGLYQPGALLEWLLNLRGLPATSDSLAALGWHQPLSLFDDVARSELPAHTTISETQGQGSFRAVPLRVAVTVAEVVAGKPVVPTLYAVSTVVPALPARYLENQLPFESRAVAGPGREVWWHVRLEGDHVIVMVSEMPC